MTHRALPGIRGSLEASIAARLSTLELEPVKNLALCRLTATAPGLGEAIERTDDLMNGWKNEKKKENGYVSASDYCLTEQKHV